MSELPPKRSPSAGALVRLAQLAVSPAGFVFDPRTGATFQANPTALALITGLQAGEGLGALADRLRRDFHGGQDDLRRDVLEFVRLLRAEGLVPRDFEVGP